MHMNEAVKNWPIRPKRLPMRWALAAKPLPVWSKEGIYHGLTDYATSGFQWMRWNGGSQTALILPPARGQWCLIRKE